MEEEFARGLGIVVEEVAVAVFVDVRVVKEDLVVVDASEGIADLAFAGAQGFDFGAFKDDSSLVGLEDVIIAASLRVREDFGIGHKRISQKVTLLAGKPSLFCGVLAAFALLGRLDELEFLGEIGCDLVFEDFHEGNVGHALADGVGDERAAQGAAARVKLAHAARYQVDEDVRVANFRQRLPAQFAIHPS